MLVLSRKNDQAVVVKGADHLENILKITVLEISGERVRLGFEAHKDVAVHREEVWERIRANGRPGRLPETPATPNEELDRWADDGGEPEHPTQRPAVPGAE